MSFEWQYISSKSNSLLVRISKLKDKKYRKAEGLFRLDGIKLFCEAAEAGAPIECVFVALSVSEKYCRRVEEYSLNAKCYTVADEVFSKLTDELSPEGIVTVCRELDNIKKPESYAALAKKALGGTVLLLASVRDAGNMGTIIRSAKAFGIDNLIISSDCADLYNSKTVRGAMGALFTQSIAVVDDVASAITSLREGGFCVYGAALQRGARKLGSFELKKTDAIVIGNEGHGLSDAEIAACNECLYIPMEEGSESLNAGVAASVCMWELYKTK